MPTWMADLIKSIIACKAEVSIMLAQHIVPHEF